MIPEKLFKQCLAIVPRCCVDVVLVCGNKVLLCRRQITPSKGYWCLPGGGIKKGEIVEKAAVRKVQQELDLTITKDSLHLAGIVSYFHTVRHDISITYAIRMPTCVLVELDYQHSAYGWYDLRDLPRPMHKPTVKQVKLAKECLK